MRLSGERHRPIHVIGIRLLPGAEAPEGALHSVEVTGDAMPRELARDGAQ